MPEVRDDLTKSRAARLLAAKLEWRQHVEAIARDEITSEDVGEQIDRLILKLQRPDDLLIADVAAMREHLEIAARRKRSNPSERRSSRPETR